jgi:glycosyltransferase involved in cell wall biosynthesis
MDLHCDPAVGDANIDRPRVAVVQDGTRRRYMVPLALQRAGILERVYTDWFVSAGSMEEKLAVLVGQFRPRLGQRMRERACPELDQRRVVRNAPLALRLHWKMRRLANPEDSYIWAAQQTANWIEREGFGSANVLYGFIRNAAPSLYRAAKAHGLATSGDQIIAPLEVEVGEMKEQVRRWPGWSRGESTELHPAYHQWERDTWAALDQITCMSDYVRDGLVSVGVPAERITVIPYPWMDSAVNFTPREKRSGPLTVGFVGAIGLRKGAPYFLEVARQFAPGRMRFVMVGDVLVDKSKLSAYGDRVEFPGPVSRSGVVDWLGQFDVFLFPSTCEGSAGAVMEAMGSALPVLTTPNAGSRVRDGIEGFVRRYDDIDGFREALARLDDDRDLMLRLGAAARARVLAYDLSAYQADLLGFFTRLAGQRH